MTFEDLEDTMKDLSDEQLFALRDIALTVKKLKNRITMGRPQFGCVQENHIWHDSPLRMRRRKAKEITQVAENPDSIKDLMLNPLLIQRELNNRSLFEFFKYFWDVISAEELEV